MISHQIIAKVNKEEIQFADFALIKVNGVVAMYC